MSLMSLGFILHFLVFARKEGALDELGGAFDDELGAEFGGGFDEFDERGGHFLVCARKGGAFDGFGSAVDEFGRGLGTGGAWR